MDSFWGIPSKSASHLILLSSEKCYSSQGVFEFLFHIHVVHCINTISRNNVTESTLHGEEVHLDFPLWSNSEVHTTIFSKYMDRLFYLEHTTNIRETH